MFRKNERKKTVEVDHCRVGYKFTLVKVLEEVSLRMTYVSERTHKDILK